MILSSHTIRCFHRPRRAITMAEAVLSTLIVGIMLVAALNTVGAARRAEYILGDHTLGAQLAEDLMSEILQQAYEDPALAAGSFGIESGETGTGSREDFDDVDDYDDWTASPPERRDGAAIPGLEGWARSVTVQWVRSNDFKTPSGSDNGVKRIVVKVSHNDAGAASLTAFRTRACKILYTRPGSAAATNTPPTASALAVPDQGQTPLTVLFMASSSDDPDAGDTLTYGWDFGDGSTAQGLTVTHTYTDGGIYLAHVTVSDGKGGVDTDTAVVEVED